METHVKTLIAELQADGVAYRQVKVIPKSPKTEFVEVMADETWKIRLKAVPEKGKANQELISFLSKLLKVPKASVTIVSGATDRNKLVKIIF
jgi:uncharacterized protein (TIGR00251 family)